MTMRFHTLNSSSQLLCGLNKQKGQSKTRPYSAPFTVKSSILLQTDGNKNSSDSRSFCSEPSLEINPSDSVLNQANAVGIIGGVSAISTLNFLKKLIGWSSKNGEDSLPFIVCSDPELSKGLLSLERSSLPKPNSKNSQLQSDQTLILENLHYKRAFLEQSGARCIVMPCHIAYSWYDEIASGCSVPFFHVGECVAMELKEANLKPIEAGSNLRIGVLATEATLSAGFYQEKLQNQGFEVVLPDKATMEHTVIPAIEALNRNDTEGARNLLRIALQVLLVRAVSTVILASDDMGALLPRDDPLLKKCINPMDSLIRSTIKWAQSTENHP